MQNQSMQKLNYYYVYYQRRSFVLIWTNLEDQLKNKVPPFLIGNRTRRVPRLPEPTVQQNLGLGFPGLFRRKNL
jgi:hypothetical protein